MFTIFMLRFLCIENRFNICDFLNFEKLILTLNLEQKESYSFMRTLTDGPILLPKQISIDIEFSEISQDQFLVLKNFTNSCFPNGIQSLTLSNPEEEKPIVWHESLGRLPQIFSLVRDTCRMHNYSFTQTSLCEIISSAANCDLISFVDCKFQLLDDYRYEELIEVYGAQIRAVTLLFRNCKEIQINTKNKPQSAKTPGKEYTKDLTMEFVQEMLENGGFTSDKIKQLYIEVSTD